VNDPNCLNSFLQGLNARIREIIDINRYQQIASQGNNIRECLHNEKLRNGLDPDSQRGVIRTTGFVYGKQFYPNTVFSVDHTDIQNEGRLGGGKDTYVLYLPFSGIYGKYRTGEFRYEERPYKVCPYCITFSALGMESAAAIARRRAERVYIVFGFDGETNLEEIGIMLTPLWYENLINVLNTAFRNNASLTTLAQAFITFLQMPREIRRKLPRISWYMIIYSYDIGRTKRITSFQMFDVAPIRNIIECVEKRYEELPTLVNLLITNKKVINEGGDEALNILAELALTRKLDNIYQFLRLLRSIIDKLGEKAKKEQNALYRLLRMNLAIGFLDSLA